MQPKNNIKMANKNKTEEQFAQVEEALSKTEQYIFDNQKSLLTILVAIVGLIAMFSVYQNFYIAPLEKEAQTEMYLAELAFQKDSFELAQFEFIKKKIGFNPILLLDDIFDKLDDHRILKLISFVNKKVFGQVFITDTHKERSEAILNKAKIIFDIFNIKNGEVSDERK